MDVKPFSIDRLLADPIDLEYIDAEVLAAMPPELVDEVCYGTKPLPETFVRYGYTERSADVVRDDPLWKLVIARRTAELDVAHLPYRMKSLATAELGMSVAARNLVRDDATFSQGESAVKTFAAQAGIQTKQEAQATAPFQIIFEMPPSKGREALPNEIDVTPDEDGALPPARIESSFAEFNPAEFEPLE